MQSQFSFGKVVYVAAFTLGVYLAFSKGVIMEFKPATKIPHRMEVHGDVRVDDYFWMRERDSKPVLDFLHQENRRTAQALAPATDLEEELYKDMRSRIKENDDSVPVLDSGYFYYSRYQTGQEYPLHCRKKGSLSAREEVYFDENEYAKGHSYFDLASTDLPPDQNTLAFAVDYVGRRQYEIQFKDLRTGRLLPDRISAVTPNLAWAEDGKTLFFVKQDPETLRAYQVFRYQLGSGAEPELVYEEKDTTFSVGISSSKTRAYLFIISEKRDSSEWRVLDAKNPRGAGEIFWPREEKHEYSLADGGDRFYILTNWQAKNFRVMEAPHTARDKKLWKDVLPANPSVFREDMDVYRDFVMVDEKENGLPHISVQNRKTGEWRRLSFPDQAYDADSVGLPEYDSQVLRFQYQTMAKPPAVYEENFVSAERVLRKQKEVPGFNQELYETRRLLIPARDGTPIPVSLVMKKGTPLGGQNPLLLYGYGSYGYSLSHEFWASTFSLVNRGFVYAQAHVRGGSEMGRDWYEQGRLKHKLNSFHDFIDVAEGLVKAGYTSPQHLHAMGGSAGGLLMGGILNMRPDLFKSVVAQVPFVDVLTTMLDESIPLTTSEYNEWGDPRKKEDYLYMKQYSPYDNVQSKDYPHLLIINGYHDSQVQYWEPAKWTAKLRELKTDKNLLLLYTEMGAGHSGASGRFEALKTLAKQFAFIVLVEEMPQ